jgi:putative chitinase
MSLIKLQEKCGVTPDGVFGKGTFTAATKYLKLSPIRAVHFFAQTAHETGNFSTFSENLNYSADGLIKIFTKYFPANALALGYARKPEQIANRVYANRMGNGDEKSGDGYKYRGRGAVQLTGKDNYKAFSDYIKKPEIMDTPSLVAEDYSFDSAIYFFDKNKLWDIADKGFSEDTIKLLSKRINGGYNGLEDRLKLTNKFKLYI